MNTIWGAELHYAPDYWPLWLIYAGVVVLLMLVGLVIHALLRRMLAPKRRAAKSIVTISTAGDSPLALGKCVTVCFITVKRFIWSFSLGPVALMVQVHTVWFCLTGFLGRVCADQPHHR